MIETIISAAKGLLHTYEVVEQARFDLGEIAAAGAECYDRELGVLKS